MLFEFQFVSGLCAQLLKYPLRERGLAFGSDYDLHCAASTQNATAAGMRQTPLDDLEALELLVGQVVGDGMVGPKDEGIRPPAGDRHATELDELPHSAVDGA